MLHWSATDWRLKWIADATWVPCQFVHIPLSPSPISKFVHCMKGKTRLTSTIRPVPNSIGPELGWFSPTFWINPWTEPNHSEKSGMVLARTSRFSSVRVALGVFKLKERKKKSPETFLLLLNQRWKSRFPAMKKTTKQEEIVDYRDMYHSSKSLFPLPLFFLKKKSWKLEKKLKKGETMPRFFILAWF